MDLFDIVIPLGANDLSIIKEQISHTKKNVIGFRNIYIVTNELVDFDDKNVIIIKEYFFPFCIENISKMRGNSPRCGWYLQQLIKLYSGFVISGILPRYLVIDADTFFLNENMVDKNMVDKNVVNENMVNENMVNENMVNENMVDENAVDENAVNENMIDENGLILSIKETAENCLRKYLQKNLTQQKFLESGIDITSMENQASMIDTNQTMLEPMTSIDNNGSIVVEDVSKTGVDEGV